MVKCAGCGKEFNPPQSHWRYCYECWMKKERQKFLSRRQTEDKNTEKQVRQEILQDNNINIQ